MGGQIHKHTQTHTLHIDHVNQVYTCTKFLFYVRQ